MTAMTAPSMISTIVIVTVLVHSKIVIMMVPATPMISVPIVLSLARPVMTETTVPSMTW